MDALGVDPSMASLNLFSYCANNPVNRYDADGTFSLPSWGKIAIGVGIIAVAAAVTVATGGAAAGTLLAAVNCAAHGAAIGAAIQGAVGAVTGAVGGAVAHRVRTGSWNGAEKAAFDGAATGFMTGTITGAVSGAVHSPYCFVAGTAVLTALGTASIESIKAGDYVWAWNEGTGETELKQVVETYINETDKLTHVFVNGEEIIATPSHPFYSPVKGWTDACKLRAGDILVLVNGEYVVVEKVQHEILENPVEVYNFQVEDDHTYYVSDTGVLVHNSCNKNITKTMSRPDAVKEGKSFLGERYTRIERGRYISADKTRTMRFDFTHHGGTAPHINLESWKYPCIPGQRNKIVKNIHIFFTAKE